MKKKKVIYFRKNKNPELLGAQGNTFL